MGNNCTHRDLVDENGLVNDNHKSIAIIINHISDAISKNSKKAEANPQFKASEK